MGSYEAEWTNSGNIRQHLLVGTAGRGCVDLSSPNPVESETRNVEVGGLAPTSKLGRDNSYFASWAVLFGPKGIVPEDESIQRNN